MVAPQSISTPPWGARSSIADCRRPPAPNASLVYLDADQCLIDIGGEVGTTVSRVDVRFVLVVRSAPLGGGVGVGGGDGDEKRGEHEHDGRELLHDISKQAVFLTLDLYNLH